MQRIMICLAILILMRALPFAQGFEANKRAIVRIETPDSMRGTGFLIKDSVLGVWLITNKHVIQENCSGRYVDSIYVRKNAISDNGRVYQSGERSVVHLFQNGKRTFVPYPDSGVDLVMIPAGNLQVTTGPSRICLSSESVVGKAELDALCKRDGLEVEVIGSYLSTGTDRDYHLSRFGHIALYVTDQITVSALSPCPGRVITCKGQWLLLDITSRGGDSGAPVFLLPAEGPIKLLGIVVADNAQGEFCLAIPSSYLANLLELARGVVSGTK